MSVLAAEPLIRWDWVGDHLAEIGSRLIEHLELTIIAVVIGFAISFPLAVLAHRRRWTYAPVTWTAGILYGYKGEYKHKVPFNYNGVSPGITVGLGWRYSPALAGQVNLLGTAGLMFLLSYELP